MIQPADAPHPALSLLADSVSTAEADALFPTLLRFPEHLLALLVRTQTRIVTVAPAGTYGALSPALRKTDVDHWPIPPVGLFVVAERTVYLRCCSTMTVAHELMHAIDCALGGGTYLSGKCPRIRRAFEKATAFVTPYAASGLDEYFAEAGRAMLSANTPHARWPPVSPARLFERDPVMFAYMTEIFSESACGTDVPNRPAGAA